MICLHYHVKGYFRILWSISEMMLKLLERHEYLVLQSISFFISFGTSHAIAIATSRMLNFRIIYSNIETMWNIPASSIMYAS